MLGVQPGDTTRKCIDCKEIKDLEFFPSQLRANAKKRTYSTRCRPCFSKYKKVMAIKKAMREMPDFHIPEKYLVRGNISTTTGIGSGNMDCSYD